MLVANTPSSKNPIAGTFMRKLVRKGAAHSPAAPGIALAAGIDSFLISEGNLSRALSLKTV